MSDYYTRREERGAYRIDLEALTELWRIAKSFAGEDVKCRITFSDKGTLEVKDLNAAPDEHLVKTKVIQNITISGPVFSPNRTLSVSLADRADLFSAPVEITLSGDWKSCLSTADQITNVLSSHREWYWFFFRPSHLSYNFFSFLLSVLVSFFLAVYIYTRTNLSISIEAAQWFVWPLTVLFVCALVLSRKWLFPVLTFEIGRSASMASRPRFWRRTIFGLFGAGILTNALYALITR